MALKTDTRNVVVTFVSIGAALAGTAYAHRVTVQDGVRHLGDMSEQTAAELHSAKQPSPLSRRLRAS